MLVRCSDLTLSRFGKLLTKSRQLFVLGQTLLLHSPVLINELLKALKHLDGRYGILGSPAASPSSVLRALQLVVQVVNLLQHVVRPFHQLVLHTSSTVIREQTANGSWVCVLELTCCLRKSLSTRVNFWSPSLSYTPTGGGAELCHAGGG